MEVTDRKALSPLIAFRGKKVINRLKIKNFNIIQKLIKINSL